MKLRKGDIVAVHGTDLLSKGVEFIIHSPISHVALVVDSTKGILIEANGLDVQHQSLDVYKGKSEILRVSTATDEQLQFVVDYCEKQLRKPYDYADILREFDRYVFGTTPKAEDGNRFICSSLIQLAYLKAGIHLCNVPLASPRDIVESKLVKFVDSY